MERDRAAAVAGAALTIVGLFCPILTLPIIGAVNLFNDGTNLIALALLALAVTAGALSANGRTRDALWPGLAAAATLICHFAMLQRRLAEMRSSLAALEGNPFAGLAKAAVGTVQLQWGWLVLASGAALMVYAGVAARRTAGRPLLSIDDGPSRSVAALSALVAAGVVGWTAFATPTGAKGKDDAQTSAAADAAPPIAGVDAGGPAGGALPSPEERAYIASSVRLYDFSARYFDSLLDGRVPGVEFKIRNEGSKTLDRVRVRVVFRDAQGRPIAEEEYSPVWIVEGGYSADDDKPLRPGYIWQNEKDHFLSAKSVPSEWKEGSATASVVGIEFSEAR